MTPFRAARLFGHVAAGTALLLVFAGASAAAFVLHLDLPAGRRFASRVVAGLLSDLFYGSFEIDGFSKLTATRFVSGQVTVRDPEGQVVLEVKGLRAELDSWDVLKKLVSSEPRVTIIVPFVRIERADASILPDPKTGALNIARAFELRPEPEKEKKTGTSQARQVRVWLPSIELDKGYAHGSVGDLPALEAELAGARGAVLVSPVGVAVDVPRFATAFRGLTSADLNGIGSFHLRGDRHVWTSFDGFFGELQVDSVVRYDAGTFKISIDLPRAEPDVARSLWADWPVQAVASGHVDAIGTPEHLQTEATLRVGPSLVNGKGVTRLSGDVGVNLEVTAKDVDLRAIWPEAPESRIDGFTTLALWDSPEGVVAEVNAQTEPFVLEGVDIPALDLTGTVEEGRFEAKAVAHEPGLPLHLDFAANPGGKLELSASTRRVRLEKAPRVARYVKATGIADGELDATLDDGVLDATLHADLENFAMQDVKLARGHVEVKAKGPFDDLKKLSVTTRLTGKHLTSMGRTFDSVKAEARGPVTKPLVNATLSGEDTPTVEAKARVALEGGPKVSELELLVKKEGTSVQAQAGKVDIRKDHIEIKDLSVTGAGELEGSISIRPKLVSIEARGNDVDLDVLAGLAGLPRGKVGGKLDVDTEIVVAGDIQRGRVELSLENGAIQDVNGIKLDLEATLDGQTLEGTARAELQGVAKGTTEFDVVLPGNVAEADTWKKATGRTELRLDELDLSHLVHLLPAAARIERVGGKLSGQVVVTRADSEELPAVTLLAGTTGLSVTRKSAEKGKPPLVIQGIEAQIGGRVDGPSGDVDATLRLLDEKGSLVTATARSNLPIGELVADRSRIVPALADATLLGKVVVDARELAALPELLRPKNVHGVLRADITVGGSVKDPIISANTSIARLSVGSSRRAAPVDLCTRVDYSEDTAELKVDAEAFLSATSLCRGKRVATLRSAGRLAIEASELPTAEGPPQIFDGDVVVDFAGLPLETITPLARSGFQGRVRGKIVLDQGGDRPQLNARLGLEALTIDQIAVGDGTVEVRSDARMLRAVGRFDKPPGKIEGQFNAALTWDGFSPALDRKSALSLEARADGVDAVILAPILRDVFSELSGRMDGKVRLALEPSPEGSKEAWTGDVSGELAMRDGAMQFQGLGMRLNDVTFVANTRTRNGRTVVEVRDFSAASRARSPNVSASADVYLAGLELQRARANVNMKDVPILIEGVSQANATGRAFLDLKPGEDRMRVLISLPKLTAELAPSSGRDVISIAPNRSIEIVQPLAEPRRRRRTPEEPKPWELTFKLGDDVKVQRADLNIPLEGQAVIALAEDTEITGTLDLKPGGRAEYFGKTFVVENGEIRFDTGDASNPHVDVVASWRAPDGTQIYVRITGTYREARLDVSSDPQRTDREIYALLLGGTTGEGAGAGGGSAAAAGIGVGAGMLDQLLSDTPLRAVELRTASEETLDRRTYSTYTAAVQISEEVWFEGSYKNLNQTETTEQTTSAFSGTVDWRFRRNWSLRTEIGTIGTGLDLLWTYRY